MRIKNYLILAVAILLMPGLSASTLAQTVHPVSAGDGTLQAALDAAVDGDILELVDSGGLYTQSASDKIVINKTITIRAQEGLAAKPIVRNTKLDASSARLFEIQAGGNLTLIGLDLDGRAEDGGAAHAKQIVRSLADVAEADSFHFNLKVEDCDLHDTKEAIVKIFANTHSDTVIFRNSFLYEARNEGIVLRESSSRGGPKVQYVELTNCTFSRIGREAFYHEFSNPVIRINHCTFDSISYRENKRIIYPKNVDDVEIKNSIFSNQVSANESVKLYGTSTIAYSDTFNVGPVSLSGSASIGAGMLGVDPQYADPANLDFRLPDASPLRGAADDGRAMGDLRWEASPNQVILTVITQGAGLVTLDPPGGIYAPGTTVTLTAVPDAGWAFDHWIGNVFPPTGNPVTILMNTNETITAKFVSLKPKYTLTVDTVGLGHVDLDPEPVDGKYDEGTVVTLTAVPQANWVFVEWLGDITGSENPVSVPVDSNMHVTARFASIFTQFTLDVDTVGLGGVMVDPQPVLGTYDSSTVVVLTAVPAPGWEFSGWSGDLSGTNNPDSVVMNADKQVTATFSEIQLATHRLEVDDSWDLRDAVAFANNNSQVDTLVLTTSGGVYTSNSTSDVAVLKPLVLMAAEGLAEKPILTNSDPEKSNLDILRVFDDFTIIGVVLDGGHELSHGMKYGIRLRHYSGSDSVKNGSNITIRDCVFRNFFQNKDPKADGHALKLDVELVAGTVRIENSTFENFGYEAIRISDTEKYKTDRAVDSLIVRNCTFTNIDAECIRYYSDANPDTPDAPVIIENLTINNSATRTMYLKNSGGAIVRNIIIANSRTSGHGRDDDLLEAQGAGTMVSHIDTFNVKAVPIKATDNAMLDTATVYGFDPMFADAANGDYTLLEGSPLYTLAHDGGALGDRRWATNAPTAVKDEAGVPLRYALSQNYPNPFNPSTTITFSLEKPGRTVLRVYDILGKVVATLVEEKMAAGKYEVNFDASLLPSGVYFYKISSGDFSAQKKMILVK